MKSFKIVISVILAVVLVITAFTACKGNKNDGKGSTQVVAVTDENGEEVTDENGEVVTTVISDGDSSDGSEGGVVVVDDNGEKTSDTANNAGEKTTAKDGKKKDDKKDNKKEESTSKGKEAVTKPAAPSVPTDLKASDIKVDGLVISWKGVKCDYYQLQYKKNGGEWKTAKDSMTATKASFEKVLDSYTTYHFRVRAINENSAGKSASKWAETKATTKADEKNERFIKVKVLLPKDSNVKETLEVYVDGKLDGEFDVRCGGKSKTVTTSKKYKGLVEVKCVLKSHKTSNKAKTDKDSVTIDLTSIGIEQDVDDESF